jgi:small-conductance mechanosensitive channel
MRSMIADIPGIPPAVADIATDIVTLAAAVAVALLIDWAAMKMLRRLSARTPSKADEMVVERIAGPLRWILIAVALSMAQRGIDLKPWAAALWQQIAGFVVPGLVGWLAIAIIKALSDVTMVRNDISVADNLRARRKRTRVGILTRIAVFAVVFLTVCMMLLSIPGIRSVGVTLMASAGLAGLAVGAAAQPALKNLIAGIQLAFTEPIRLDDVVIMDGEWGRIEEIRLTYIVVRIWDDRRLIVPVSKFLEESFQNWTRSTAELMGSVFFLLDWTADVARIRDRAGELIAANPRWDRRFWNLQVTDMKEETMEVRVLVTARDASTAFDLRCDVREALIAFIAAEMPEALPRRRQMPTAPLTTPPAQAGEPSRGHR